MDPISERLLWFVLGFLSGGLTIGGLTARRLRPRTPAPDEPPAPMPPAATSSHDPSPEYPLPDYEPPHAPSPARLIDVGAARASGFNLRHAEDLTIIEGIGPRTEELLRTHGIGGFLQLAATGEDELRAILDHGGPSFRYANPAQWAPQAELAIHNDWTGLRQLQQTLRGFP